MVSFAQARNVLWYTLVYEPHRCRQAALCWPGFQLQTFGASWLCPECCSGLCTSLPTRSIAVHWASRTSTRQEKLTYENTAIQDFTITNFKTLIVTRDNNLLHSSQHNRSGLFKSRSEARVEFANYHADYFVISIFTWLSQTSLSCRGSVTFHRIVKWPTLLATWICQVWHTLKSNISWKTITRDFAIHFSWCELRIVALGF